MSAFVFTGIIILGILAADWKYEGKPEQYQLVVAVAILCFGIAAALLVMTFLPYRCGTCGSRDVEKVEATWTSKSPFPTKPAPQSKPDSESDLPPSLLSESELNPIPEPESKE